MATAGLARPPAPAAPTRAGASAVDSPATSAASAGVASEVHAPADSLAAWRLTDEPHYQPSGDECERFAAAHAQRIPLLIKGPTGCGKTRFVAHMAWRLGLPLVTVACHEDLTANDLIGRWLLVDDRMHWQDGPLTLAARHGAICYLDELVESRPDATVVIHPLTDTRRMLPLATHGECVAAHPDFQLVVSYNPSPMARELKSATRQRFCAMQFGYPGPALETAIVAQESGQSEAAVAPLVAFGASTRRLQGQGLEEGASTRMLVHAASLLGQGLSPATACRMAVVDALTDEPDVHEALCAALEAAF